MSRRSVQPRWRLVNGLSVCARSRVRVPRRTARTAGANRGNFSQLIAAGNAAVRTLKRIWAQGYHRHRGGPAGHQLQHPPESPSDFWTEQGDQLCALRVQPVGQLLGHGRLRRDGQFRANRLHADATRLECLKTPSWRHSGAPWSWASALTSAPSRAAQRFANRHQSLEGTSSVKSQDRTSSPGSVK